MKRIGNLLLFIVLLFILFGCNGRNTNDSVVIAEEQPVQYDVTDMRIRLPSYATVSVRDNDGQPDISIFLPCHSISQKSISDFASTIYQSFNYCKNHFDGFKVSVGISTDETVPMLWVSSISEWGVLIDNRSGEQVIAEFRTVDDLCAFFPTLNSDVNCELIDEHDLEIYREVMNEIDSNTSKSEDEILYTMADKYGLTSQQLSIFIKDVMQKVNSSSHVFEAKTPIVFPRFTESELFGYFKNAPDIIFTSYADENGLKNNIYSVTGTVTEYGSFVASGYDMEYLIIETERGSVMFHNTYKNALELDNGNGSIQIESLSDYCFPQIGSNVKVYGIYHGMSDVFHMPTFTYGIPKWVKGT